MHQVTRTSMIAAAVVACGLAGAADPDYAQQARAMLQQDFRAKGPATMERLLDQDQAQAICSLTRGKPGKEQAAAIEAAQLKTIKAPADGKYVGNWQEGEKIAQNGRGMQSSDAVGGVNGGNCYACHQMSKEEISFGNIGPTLYQYGKIRGSGDEVVRYTWGKINNAQAYSACTSMPRFGHAGILTESQLKDIMALLLDPASPVNK